MKPIRAVLPERIVTTKAFNFNIRVGPLRVDTRFVPGAVLVDLPACAGRDWNFPPSEDKCVAKAFRTLAKRYPTRTIVLRCWAPNRNNWPRTIDFFRTYGLMVGMPEWGVRRLEQAGLL